MISYYGRWLLEDGEVQSDDQLITALPVDPKWRRDGKCVMALLIFRQGNPPLEEPLAPKRRTTSAGIPDHEEIP